MAASFGIPLPMTPAAVVLSAPALKVFEQPDAVGEPIVTLHQCKHVDRTTKRLQCSAALHLRAHKRGYLAVACDAGHQWVWCAHCCDCSLGTRGCIMPAHWMERDSYDTGKRNHMQRHLAVDNGSSSGVANSAASAKQRALDARPMLKVKEVPAPLKKILLSTGIGAQPYVAGIPAVGIDGVAQLMVPGTTTMPAAIASVAAANPLLQVAGMPVAVPNINSSLYVTPKTAMLYVSPAPNASSRTLWTDGSLALFSQGLQILQRCKHVDRKRNRMPCPCKLRTRNHKRGYLAIVCEAGHQWVWCSYCCDCARPQVGCCNPNHWMERDSFDTGRRNHMQRHLENYDANDDEDGQIMAMMAPRQVAMPKLVIQSQGGPVPPVSDVQAAGANSSAPTQHNSEEGEERDDDDDDSSGDEQDAGSSTSSGPDGDVTKKGAKRSVREERGEAVGSFKRKRKSKQQHPLFNDELAELAATALMALAQNRRPE